MIPRRTVILAGGSAIGLSGLAWFQLRHPEPPLGSKTPLPVGGATVPMYPLKGPAVVRDPRLFPASFQEAPMLAREVRAGRLPPVAERIGLDPIVVRPLHEIGSYGGTIRRAFVGPEDTQGVGRFASGPDGLLAWDYAWREIYPNIARDFVFSADQRVLTLSLRRGMRWSSGAPFSADDILFWYERMYLDRRIVGGPSLTLQMAGRDVVVRKVDDLTVEFVSPAPYPLLADVLASYSELGGPSFLGHSGMGGYAPRHYLEQYHASARSEDELNREAHEAGFANWTLRFRALNDWTLNPDLPVTSPWRVTSPINSQKLTLARNPYCVWIDTAGNQLPYVDFIDHVLCLSADGVVLKAAAGELDFQDRHIYVSKLPFLLSNRRKANYVVGMNPYQGTDLAVRFNLNHKQDPEIGALLADVRFRRALSLALNRPQINDTLLFGTALPSASTPSPDCKYYPGDAWAQRWATHDPERANRMLDRMGLSARDKQGFRLRRDGGGRLRLVVSVTRSGFDYAALGEMIHEQWREIGVDLDLRELEGTLFGMRMISGELQMTLQSTFSEDPFIYPDFLFPSSPYASGALLGVEYAQWFRSNGARGQKPPPDLVEIMELWRRGRSLPDEQRLEAGREIIRRHIDLVLTAGIVSAGLANNGVHVASNDVGNVPQRILNTAVLRSPSNVLPMTFYFRNAGRRRLTE